MAEEMGKGDLWAQDRTRGGRERGASSTRQGIMAKKTGKEDPWAQDRTGGGKERDDLIRGEDRTLTTERG